MRKIKKSVVALLLLVSVMFSFASCDLINEVKDFLDVDFGGPGTTSYDAIAVKWVETYEEMIAIVEKMRATGTEVPQIPAFNCEEYGIDVKFRILFYSSYISYLEEGKEIYDIPIISVTCYIFFEDVTIDDLEKYHTTPSGMNGYCVTQRNYNIEINAPSITDSVEFSKNSVTSSERISYGVKYNGEYKFSIVAIDNDIALTKEQIEILKKTLVVI